MFRYMDQAYAVYQAGSFTKAAKQLCISQPALSATIKKLEDRLGYPIFDRSSKTLALTDIGQRYIRAAEQILQIRQNMEQEIDDLVQLRRGSVILGGTTFIISEVLPVVLKAFGKTYSDIEVKIQVEPSTVLYEKLEQGAVDIAIDNALSQDPEHTYLPLFREHILIGIPSENPINQKLTAFQLDPEAMQQPDCDYSTLPKLDVSLLAQEEFILLKSGNKMRQIAHNIFLESGVSPKIRFEFDRLTTSISFGESGFGICFLTDTILKYSGPCKNLILYQPDTRFADRNLYLMYKKNKYLNAATRTFVDFLQETFKKDV